MIGEEEKLLNKPPLPLLTTNLNEAFLNSNKGDMKSNPRIIKSSIINIPNINIRNFINKPVILIKNISNQSDYQIERFNKYVSNNQSPVSNSNISIEPIINNKRILNELMSEVS